MKNIIGILILLCTIMFIGSCSKNSDQPTYGYWNLYGKQYNIHYIKRMDSLGYSVLKGWVTQPSNSTPVVNSIYIWFPSGIPNSNGSYEMIDYNHPRTPLTGTQIGISGIITNDFPTQHKKVMTFDATGIASMSTWPWPKSAKAEVSVTNGKIRVDIPITIARVEILAGGLDSVAIQGVYQEK